MRRSSTRESNLAGVTSPKNRQLAVRHGALPHRARHSNSSTVNIPSVVVPPPLTPKLSSMCSSSSYAPFNRQAMLVQTHSTYLPTGSVNSMS